MRRVKEILMGLATVLMAEGFLFLGFWGWTIRVGHPLF
jgi:hypothetical protein